MSDPRLSDVTIDWVRPFFPTKLPRDWERVDEGMDGARWLNAREHMSVILSGAVEGDGKRWVHVSVARRNYLPTWADLSWVKETWLGKTTTAYQVIPPRDRFVNLHPHCLHLWYCLDGPPLPEFSGLVGNLRTI